MLGEKVYDLVLYNYAVKNFVRWVLTRGAVIKNPAYSFFYNRAMRRHMNDYANKPFRVMMENTNLCGADCGFCPHNIIRRPLGTMDMDLSRKITDECAGLGIDYLTIYGFGEPLLDKYFFERIRYAKMKGIRRVTTNTNAAHMDEEKSRLLIESGIDEVYISFDAFSESAYKEIRPNLDFFAVRRNILGLLERRRKRGTAKPLVILSFVECDANRREAGDYIKYWRPRADHISVSFSHNWAGSIKNILPEGAPLNNRAARAGLRDPCRLLWTDMFILYSGAVALCCNDYEGRGIIGDVKNASISSVWGGKAMSQIRELHLKGQFDKLPMCCDCSYNYHHKSNWWVSK